jgi:hypothetical protein
VKSMQKKCVKVVALGMHTATIEKDTKRGWKGERLALYILDVWERESTAYSIRCTTWSRLLCGQEVSRTAVRTALVYYCIHGSLNTGTVHRVQRCWSTAYCCLAGTGGGPGCRQPPQPHILWLGLKIIGSKVHISLDLVYVIKKLDCCELRKVGSVVSMTPLIHGARLYNKFNFQ